LHDSLTKFGKIDIEIANAGIILFGDFLIMHPNAIASGDTERTKGDPDYESTWSRIFFEMVSEY
jgi:hypothetical protein